MRERLIGLVDDMNAELAEALRLSAAGDVTGSEIALANASLIFEKIKGLLAAMPTRNR